MPRVRCSPTPLKLVRWAYTYSATVTMCQLSLRFLLVGLLCGACSREPQTTSTECVGDYTRKELLRWYEDVQSIMGTVEGANTFGLSRRCIMLGIEAESLRPQVDAELRRLGVPLDAVEVPIITMELR